MTNEKLLLGGDGIENAIRKMTEELVAGLGSPEGVVLVGIRTHGVTVAQRIRDLLAARHEWDVPLGILDITLYRDDFDQRETHPIVRTTRLDFDVTDRIVVLVDDVLFTGRTVRCALDAMMDFGRPRVVRLAVLVDRGSRELPVQPDVVGVRVETTQDQRVVVRFGEEGGEEGVWICDRPRAASG